MKKLNSQQFLKLLMDYLWMTLAGMLNGISLYTFVNPSHLIAGGFSGLSSALTYVLNLFITTVSFDQLMSVVYFILNIPLLICSLIFLRGDFTFKTIWATIVCTVTLAVLPKYFPSFQFHESRLIAIIFGGLVIGMSMYIASEYNGSNGGTEIIAKIVSKYRPEIDLSKVVLLANLIIAISGSIVVLSVVEGTDPSIIVYSFTYIFIGAGSLGMLKRGFNHPQKYIIVTTEYEQITQDITTYFKRGCSCMDVENTDPTKPQRKMVMVIVQYRQTQHLKQLIKTRDPHAFVFVKEVHDIFSRPTFNRSYKTK